MISRVDICPAFKRQAAGGDTIFCPVLNRQACDGDPVSSTGTAGPVNLLPGGSGVDFEFPGCGEGAEGLCEALAGCGHGAVSFRSFPRVFPDFSKPAKSLNHRKKFQKNCIDTDAPPLSFSPSGLDGSALADCAEIEA